MNESRADMLARHARELAELESRWWEEWFTEDPMISINDSMGWYKETIKCRKFNDWIRQILPTIIRKREKIGVTIRRFDVGGRGYSAAVTVCGVFYSIPIHIAETLAGRTLAPVEKEEI